MHRVAPVLFLWQRVATVDLLMRIRTYPVLYVTQQNAKPAMLKRYTVIRRKARMGTFVGKSTSFDRLLRKIKAFITAEHLL